MNNIQEYTILIHTILLVRYIIFTDGILESNILILTKHLRL
jgi:hypothetical protein